MGGKVTLNWTDNADNETGFRIQYATSSNFNGAVESQVGMNVTTFTATNLTRATNYYFRIQAFNSNSSSAWVNATPFPINP